MPHYPINHPLGGFYRGLAIIAAVLMVVYPLALSGNNTFAAIMIVLAAAVFAGVFLGRERYQLVNETVGAVLIHYGILGLLVMESRFNYLDLTVSSCIVLFLLGTVLLTAGMYTKTGTAEQAAAEDAYRHAGDGRVAEPAKAISAPHTHAEEHD